MVSQRKAGAALSYVNILAKNLINIAYTPILLRFLSQANYGVYQMTNSVVASLSLLSMGFSSAYVRFYAQRKAKGDKEGVRQLNGMYLIVFLCMAIVACLAGAILWANTATLFHKGLTAGEIGLAKSLILVMVFNLALTFPSSVFDSFIMVHEKFIFQQSRQLFSSLAAPIVAIGLLLLGCGALGVALAQTFVAVVLLCLNIRYATRTLGMQFNFRSFDWSLLKAIAIFSFWILLNQVFDLINNSVPNFLLGAMANANIVAVFSIAIQIRNIFFNLSTTLSSVFVPKINDMVATKDDNHELTKLMVKVGRYQLILFCLIFGGFALVGEYFIKVWAGETYTNAYWLIIIMTLPVMIPLIQNTGIEIQRAKNKHEMRSIIYMVTSVIDLIICVIFIPQFGYWATAWGYVASIVLGTGLFMNWYYHCRIGLNMVYFWKKMLPTLITSICVFVVCELFTHLIVIPGFAGFITYGIIYVILFVIAAWFFIITKAEKQSLINKITRA